MARQSEQNSDDRTDELRVLTRLLALSIIEGKKQKDQIRILSVAGMGRKDIADLIGTTPLTVSVVMSNLKKERSARGKKRRQ